MPLIFLALSVIFVILSAFWTVILFLKDFYRLSSQWEAFWWLLGYFIRRLAQWNSVVIREGKIAGPDRAAARIGGPGYAVILEDSAAVFERYGRITRVLGPGYYWLDPYERPRGAVDLRPQTRRIQVRGFTRDGIPVQGEVEIEFQLHQITRIGPEKAPGERRSRRFRSFYTFSWGGTLKAVHHVPVREGSPMTPGEVVGEEVAYQFQKVVEAHNLNELLACYPEAAPGEGKGLVSRDAMRILETELFNALRAALKRWGYQVNRLQINALDVSEEAKERVKARFFALWKSYRLAKLKGKEAEADVSALLVMGRARAYAEAKFIEDLASEIAALSRTSLDRQMIPAIAFVNVLGNLLANIKEESQFLLPGWILEQMDYLKKLLALP